MKQTYIEEFWNALSHGMGTLFGLAALVLMMVFSSEYDHAITIVASAIYGSTLVLLYSASALYHVCRSIERKKLFKKLDHSSIYLLIAGSYTPFALVTMHGALGWTIFGIIWSLAAMGLVFKLFFTGRYNYLSLTMYLLMGWLIVIAIKPLMHDLRFGGLVWLVIGGLCYTLGAIFYAYDSRVKYFHFVWHLFVLAGSICQFFSVLYYVIL